MSVLAGKEAPNVRSTAVMGDNTIREDFELTSGFGR